MSRIRVKTKYNTEGIYGSTEEKILYADHNNSSDYVTYYDEDDEIIMIVPDTIDNNLLDAINRLYMPYDNNKFKNRCRILYR
jgi:hypothetical protein